MVNKIEIPKWLQFKIYFSLIITTFLFISVYFVLFYIGGWISINWWETSELYNSFGMGLVIIGLIPLIYALSVKSGEQGFEAKEKDFPELFKCIREIANEFNIKMPSKILILPTEEIFVTGVFNKKIGIGIAGLRAITNEELKAILRHEFGHFYGNDTIVGSILSRIQISLESSSKFGKSWWDAIPLMEIAIIGLFIAGFSKAYSFIFRVIISIYSRQVEYRADFVASKKSGEEAFGNALLNYSAYTTYFEQVSYNSVIQLLKEGRAFMNIYDSVYRAYEKEENEHEILKHSAFDSNRGSFLSSHPKLTKRLKKINLNPDSMKVNNKIKNSAISLIRNRKKVEEELTQVITNNLHVNLLYANAVAREGKCRYCGEQFEQLQDLLEHEEQCKNRKTPK